MQRYNTIVMDSLNGTNYTARFTASQNTETLDYYIYAEDIRGMHETLPKDGRVFSTTVK